jgi:hypothetical protein
MPRLLWIGVAVLVLGTGPLLLVILATALGLTDDPNPNPIGPGLLAFVSFWPGVVLTIIGLAQARRPRK